MHEAPDNSMPRRKAHLLARDINQTKFRRIIFHHRFCLRAGVPRQRRRFVQPRDDFTSTDRRAAL
jgi:hypothetical protein